jgi:hypothetical protein
MSAMKMRLVGGALVLAVAMGMSAGAEQPRGVAGMLQNLASEPSTHTSFTFDRDMLQAMGGALGDDGKTIAGLSAITFENYHYHQPAFYIPGNMHAIVAAYREAGWMHLVDQNASPRESASPTKPLTDLWLHFDGMNIDGVTVLVRGVKQMTVIEVSGILKPLDLVHLSGHFGIPKVDPNAVMVPAPPGK